MPNAFFCCLFEFLDFCREKSSDASSWPIGGDIFAIVTVHKKDVNVFVLSNCRREYR